MLCVKKLVERNKGKTRFIQENSIQAVLSKEGGE